MSHISVITDSTSCIPQDLMDSLNIRMAPITIILGDKEYRDMIDITPEVFYKRIKEENIYVTTSGGIVGEFVKIYEDLQGKVDGIVAIVLPPELPSAGYASAVRAASLMEGMNIEVIDSGYVMPAQGFIVLAAARAAAQGADLTTVAGIARDVSSRINLLFVPEDLKYWKRLGRFIMPGTEEDWAKIQPVLTMRNGKITLEENCEKGHGIERMLEMVRERTKKGSPLHLAVFDAGNPALAEKVREQIVKDVHCDEFFMSLITPVVGIHTGPGTVGVAFYNE